MFPFIARIAVVSVVGHLLGRVVKHPRVAPIARSRKGRLALLALDWGMRRRARVGRMGRRS